MEPTEAKAFKFLWSNTVMVFVRNPEESGLKNIVSKADLLRLT